MRDSVASGVAAGIVACYLIWMLARAYQVAHAGWNRKWLAYYLTGFALYAPRLWWDRLRIRFRQWAYTMVDKA